jgi:hypothetical protein
VSFQKKGEILFYSASNSLGVPNVWRVGSLGVTYVHRCASKSRQRYGTRPHRNFEWPPRRWETSLRWTTTTSRHQVPRGWYIRHTYICSTSYACICIRTSDQRFRRGRRAFSGVECSTPAAGIDSAMVVGRKPGCLAGRGSLHSIPFLSSHYTYHGRRGK